jgi:acetyl esterase/lipase
MSGVVVRPRPTALVAYSGYGDVDGPWYSKPSPHYRKEPLVTKGRAYAGIGREVVSRTDRQGPGGTARALYYLYLRQNGLWTKEVTGFDPATQREQLTPYCPVRNVTADYPPTALVHGTADTDVPYDLAVAMARELKRHGVRHELITVPDAGHGLGSGDGKLIARARAKALEFIKEHLK